MSSINLDNLRHSLAHLLGAAVLELYPGSKLAIGPAIDDGFYYDIDVQGVISDNDLPKIEKRMHEILKTWKTFEGREVTAGEAKELFPDNQYKKELIDELAEKKEKITLYTSGNFTDLCRGGHIDNTKDIDLKAFKLSRVAGAYWRGDEKNPQLTRIYGWAFNSKKELEEHIVMLEEAKKRDHRMLGEKLDLFHFDESIGKGLPLWLPKGNIIKEQLENWAKETEEKWGYQRVTTPIITKENLFYTSGHLPLYKDSMYAPIMVEEENYYIKPMNCPFHHKVYSARPKSYRDLPYRLAEYGWCHRYEDSGSLFGLMRVRGMQMNDAHIYVQKENAVEEFVNVIRLHEYYYKTLGINTYEMELALRDPKNMSKYHGDESDWQDAERLTIEAMEKSGVPYKIIHEGAAFYGPKMDFQIYSSTGRPFTASTNQLDLYMGKRFNLEYTDKDGQQKVPTIIHRAPLGTHERFIGFLIEHYAGAFPVWLSPVQAAILPISDKQNDWAEKVYEELKSEGIRVEINRDNETLGKKIRAAEIQKIPYLLVIGDKEVEAKSLAIRKRGEGDLGQVEIKEFVKNIKKEITSKS